MNSGGGRDGGTIHTVTKMAELKRCEDASKNDQGWLVSDWRWISVIFELGVTDGRMDGPSYRDARMHLKIEKKFPIFFPII